MRFLTIKIDTQNSQAEKTGINAAYWFDLSTDMKQLFNEEHEQITKIQKNEQSNNNRKRRFVD